LNITYLFINICNSVIVAKCSHSLFRWFMLLHWNYCRITHGRWQGGVGPPWAMVQI